MDLYTHIHFSFITKPELNVLDVGDWILLLNLLNHQHWFVYQKTDHFQWNILPIDLLVAQNFVNVLSLFTRRKDTDVTQI